jgi:hypothetical protein
VSGPTIRVRFAKARVAERWVASVAPPATAPAAPSRIARMLALAHHIERLVEAGELSGYAEAARELGLTRARVTQVMNLMLLAPVAQGRVLLGQIGGTERILRTTACLPEWTKQSHG